MFINLRMYFGAAFMFAAVVLFVLAFHEVWFSDPLNTAAVARYIGAGFIFFAIAVLLLVKPSRAERGLSFEEYLTELRKPVSYPHKHGKTTKGTLIEPAFFAEPFPEETEEKDKDDA